MEISFLESGKYPYCVYIYIYIDIHFQNNVPILRWWIFFRIRFHLSIERYQANLPKTGNFHPHSIEPEVSRILMPCFYH